jgi:hypothetical protein
VRTCGGTSTGSSGNVDRATVLPTTTIKQLGEILYQLEAEFIIFDKLLYKNNTQQRKFIHFGKLLQVTYCSNVDR